MLKDYRTKLWVALLSGLLLAACGGGAAQTPGQGDYPPEMIEAGRTLFGQTCYACHGPDGRGLPNLGKDLTTSAFVAERSDEELLAYVKQGRPADDPMNTTGIAMPPKGGFDYLTDEDILKIIAFVRSIHE
jgi:mono/diheme cytochrome c family protein